MPERGLDVLGSSTSVPGGVPALVLLEGQVGIPEGERRQNDLGSVEEWSFPRWPGNPF